MNVLRPSPIFEFVLFDDSLSWALFDTYHNTLLLVFSETAS
jgi:hypothetical protein